MLLREYDEGVWGERDTQTQTQTQTQETVQKQRGKIAMQTWAKGA